MHTLNPAERAALAALRALAAQHPVDVRLLAACGPTEAYFRQTETQTIALPPVRVTLTLEHGQPVGDARHLSVWRDDGQLPSPDVVWAVAEAVGFYGSLHACSAFLEPMGGGTGWAINLIQPVVELQAGRA